jgi:hypothetical protein
MRHALVAISVLLLAAGTVRPARAGEGYTILDATLIMVPGSPINMCLRLEPGTVAVTTRLIPSEDATMPDGRPRLGEFPVDVAVYAYRGRSDTPGIATTATTAEAVSISPIPGGPYCIAIANQVKPPPGQNPNFWGQIVAIKITHEAQP